MSHKELILILGGSRSGKSEFAEQLAGVDGDQVCYLATGVVTDLEMKKRVEQHQKRRSPHWGTIEEPLNPLKALETLKGFCGILLMDSLSGWLANLLYQYPWGTFPWGDQEEAKALAEVESLLKSLGQATYSSLIVGDEVGMGLVPPSPEGRAFRDLNGKANQLVAAAADQVYFIIAGQPLKIK
ncbi:MAG: bifunctional adenosylcobinamide kinase/adenosylcobinamide-phosphate guanylyltransferase [Bacillota bacterium]